MEKPKTYLNTEKQDKEDKRLVMLCRKGEQAAWDRIVEKYQRLIVSIPRRAGLNEEQVADVFQDVFVTLLEKIDLLERPEKLRSWLVTTSKFKTWQIIRGRKDIDSIDEEDERGVSIQLPDSSPLPDEALSLLEEQHIVRTALSELEEKCRTILTMLYLSEPSFSYAEVGKAIGVGETSISPMRTRCLKKLEKVLKK